MKWPFVVGEMIANAQQREKTFEKNIFNFFLERASICNFCCATNQNNPCKYVLYDRSQQPCGKFLSWASAPTPLGNFYSLAPPSLGISINHLWGVWIFSGTTQCNENIKLSWRGPTSFQLSKTWSISAIENVFLVSIAFYIITQVILAFLLVLVYDLLEDRRIDDDSARFKFFFNFEF